MKIKPIKRTIKATALCNPDPSFVSQVRAGANQRPFRAIKMDAAAPASEHEGTETPMKIKQKANATVAAIAPKGYGIMQFEFQKSEFADENAVKAWLDAGGYEDYEITTTSKGFEVSDNETKFETGSVMRIEDAADGVAVFVGKLTSEEAPAEEPTGEGDPAPEGGQQEAAAKADDADAGDKPAIDPPARTRAASEGEGEGGEAPQSEETDPPAQAGEGEGGEPAAKADEPTGEGEPAPVEKTEGEEAPAGEGGDAEPTDVERAREIVESIGKTQKTKGVYEAGELGRIVNQLGWVVYDADYAGLSEEVVSAIKTAALALLEAYLLAASQAADELTAVFRTAEEREAVETARAAEPTTEQPADLAAVVAAEVARAMQPVNERLAAAETTAAEATQRADAAQQEATAATERAEKAERELQERVEADNSTSQTRKGAEDLSTDESTDKKPEGRSRASKALLGAFGSRHARD